MVRESQGKMIKSEKVREKSGILSMAKLFCFQSQSLCTQGAQFCGSVVQIYGIGHSSYYIFNPLQGRHAMKWPWGKIKTPEQPLNRFTVLR